MQTKLSIDIIDKSYFLDAITKMITNHNTGEVVVTLDLIDSWLLGEYCRIPSIIPSCTVNFENSNTMHISENGKHTLTVSMREVQPLNDIPAELFTQPSTKTE
jgi:hypothetical protein